MSKNNHALFTHIKLFTLHYNYIYCREITKWLCPEKNRVQFCDEDIGCPMMYNKTLLGIASQRYNWRTWALKIDCGNLDVELRYLFLNWNYVEWIKNIIEELN